MMLRDTVWCPLLQKAGFMLVECSFTQDDEEKRQIVIIVSPRGGRTQFGHLQTSHNEDQKLILLLHGGEVLKVYLNLFGWHSYLIHAMLQVMKV